MSNEKREHETKLPVLPKKKIRGTGGFYIRVTYLTLCSFEEAEHVRAETRRKVQIASSTELK